jgi:hypothetical protein
VGRRCPSGRDQSVENPWDITPTSSVSGRNANESQS